VPYLVLSLTAFCTVCTNFALHDDMGHLMLTQKTFFSGHPLYDQTYTRYGPAYFAFRQLLLLLTRLPLSHDSTLLFTSFSWVAISLLCAGFVARLGRNVLLVAVTLFVVFYSLGVLRNEPGHPQEFCGLLLGGMLLCASFLTSGRRPAVLLGVMGFLVGLLGMTKPNLGVFAAVAGAVGLLPLAPPGKVRNALFWLSAAVALTLPIGLMHRNLAGFGGYCLIESAAMLVLVIRLASLKPVGSVAWRQFGAALAGLAGGALVGIVYALATGSSFSGLAWGLLLQHAGFDQAFLIYPSFGLEDAVLSVGLAGGLCALVGRGRGLWPGTPWVPDAIKAGAGACIALAPLLLNISDAFLWCLPAVAMTAGLTPGQSRSAFELAPRCLAVSLAVLIGLWGYPVWGPAQQGLSYFLLIPVAIVSFADAIRCSCWREGGSNAHASIPPGSPDLTALPPEPVGAQWLRTAWIAISYAAAAGVVGLASLQADRAVAAYQRLDPSSLLGSRFLHMPRDQADFYRRLIQAAGAHGRSFFTMPCLGSLYLWANQEPPTYINPTSWMTLLTPDQQSKVVADLQKTPDLCVIRWNPMVRFWAHGQDISQNKIVRYIEDNFITVESFADCDILVRRSSAR
jgi:hypothetical protein